MKSITFVLLSLVLPGFSIAQKLDDLNWMTGYWKSSQNGNIQEEIWTTVSGGMMLGLHRDVFSDGRSSFEYFRIVESETGIEYLASPGGQEPTPFTLTDVIARKAVFENLEHDFPQRIIYSLDGDKLTARVEDESGENGTEWTWIKTNFNE